MQAIMGASAQSRGVLCIVGAAILLTANDSLIKWLSPNYPLHEIVLVRAVVALFLTLFIIRLEGGLAILRTHRPVLHFLRGFLLVIANMSFFLGIAAMPIAEATALFFAAPLLITALSWPVLGEPVGPWRWTAVLIGLVGVVVMLRPGAETAQWAAVLPLIAATAYASTQVMTRRLGITDKASTMAFYVQICFIIATLAIGAALGDGRFSGGDNASLEFLFRAWRLPTIEHASLMVLVGGLIAAGGYLMTQAYRLAEPSAVAPFEYCGMPSALFWGFVLWGDWPDAVSFVGIALIVGGGLFVFYREARLNRPIGARPPTE